MYAQIKSELKNWVNKVKECEKLPEKRASNVSYWKNRECGRRVVSGFGIFCNSYSKNNQQKKYDAMHWKAKKRLQQRSGEVSTWKCACSNISATLNNDAAYKLHERVIIIVRRRMRHQSQVSLKCNVPHQQQNRLWSTLEVQKITRSFNVNVWMNWVKKNWLHLRGWLVAAIV